MTALAPEQLARAPAAPRPIEVPVFVRYAGELTAALLGAGMLACAIGLLVVGARP